jgi:hypothetical protein
MNQLTRALKTDTQNSRSMRPSSVRKALLIVGVSRSGTSVLSHLIHALGAASPKALLGPGRGNPMGHWEPKALVALNDEILAAMGRRWSDPRAIPRAWFSSPAAYDCLLRVTRQIQTDYGDAPLIVLKDPRLARLMPLYLAALDILNIEPLVILPVRPPSEVVASLVNRDGMSTELAECLWLRGVVEAEFASRSCLRSWLSFDSVLQDWEAVAIKLAQDFALIWPNAPACISDEVDGFVKPRFRHRSEEEDQPVLSHIVTEAWDAAQQAMRGQESVARHMFDAVRSVLRDLDRLSKTAVAIAAEEARVEMNKTLTWRLVRRVYGLERMIRGRRDALRAS